MLFRKVYRKIIRKYSNKLFQKYVNMVKYYQNLRKKLIFNLNNIKL